MISIISFFSFLLLEFIPLETRRNRPTPTVLFKVPPAITAIVLRDDDDASLRGECRKENEDKKRKKR